MDDASTGLWQGVKKGNITQVSAAIAEGADVDARDNHKRTPLMEAVKRGHQSLVSFLIKHGADVNAQDKTGATPLAAALLPDYTEMVALLLQAGADGSVSDKDGDTAFALICQKQNIGGLGALASIILFVLLGQRRSTKDKDLRLAEAVEMLAKLYVAYLTYRKYEGMKRMLREVKGSQE